MKTPVPHLIRFGFKHIIKVKFISLVNLIANKEIVPEMLADRFTVDGIANDFIRFFRENLAGIRCWQNIRKFELS